MDNTSHIDKLVRSTTRQCIERNGKKYFGMKEDTNGIVCSGCDSDRPTITIIGFADEGDKHVNHYECSCGNLISIVSYLRRRLSS